MSIEKEEVLTMKSKLFLIILLSIVLVNVSFLAQDAGQYYQSEGSLTTKKQEQKEIPLYISNFWANLSIEDIPNNNKEYNCTATVQMLYTNWLKNLARELGYNNVEEMINYSLKVIKIKKIIEQTDYNPKEMILVNNNSLISHPKGMEYWLKIYELLTSCQPRDLEDSESIEELLLKIGLLDEDYKTSSWEIFELMRQRGEFIFEKTDKDGTPAIEIWKKEKRYIQSDKWAITKAIPGDIITGKYYATHYPERYTTHLAAYLGKREDQPCFAEQFGIKVKITNIEKMYDSLRTGFEAIMRPIIVIEPKKAVEFLYTPLNNYRFGKWTPQILFFKDNAEEYLNLIDQKIIQKRQTLDIS